MPTTRAVVPTEHASRYLQQLCSTGRKFAVTFDERDGTIEMPSAHVP